MQALLDRGEVLLSFGRNMEPTEEYQHWFWRSKHCADQLTEQKDLHYTLILTASAVRNGIGDL